MNFTRDEAQLEATGWGWWLLLFVGPLSVLAGVIILFQPGSSLGALAVIAGIFLLLDGIFELIRAFMQSAPNRGLAALFGAMTAIVGVLLIRHPVAGVAAVALLIGIWLIAVGVIRLATAFDETENRGWHIFAGALELIAGIVIVASPDIGYATLALLVGIGFIVNGVGITALGWNLRRLANA
jgi:uncharacterized membrane protein HdeD (DUF308 family)